MATLNVWIQINRIKKNTYNLLKPQINVVCNEITNENTDNSAT